MPDSKANIELFNEEVNELLAKVPNSIIRWGTTVITLILLLFFAGSALFKYPDTIDTQIILTTQTPPVKLFAKLNGKIEYLFVRENQQVNKGDMIVLLETAANYEDVLEVKKISEQLTENPLFNSFNRKFRLGEIQSYFSAFTREYHDYHNFLSLNYHNKKISALKEELLKHDQYYQKLEEQAGIQKREYQLSLGQFKRDSLLFLQGVTSAMDFEKSESALMGKFFSFKETETNLANAKIQMTRITQQMLDMELFFDEEKKERQNRVMEAYERLQAEIEIWKQKYLLITPIDGRVSFTRFWSENQQVNTGDLVVTVVPRDTGKIIGKVTLGVAGAGKVRPGQVVNIKFSNYPYFEFGMVKGVVASVSPVPEKNFYAAEVELTSGLVTNYGIPIEFKQEMPGQAEIITDEISLMNRIFNPFKSSVKKYLK
jgi:multidrug resistance efflux pump